MVAAFLEVHHDIEQGDRLGTTCVQLLKVLGEDPAVELLLHGGQVHPHYQLPFWRNVLEDVSLEATQEVRGQQVMQLGNLVLLRDVLKFLLELFQGARGVGQGDGGTWGRRKG